MLVNLSWHQVLYFFVNDVGDSSSSTMTIDGDDFPNLDSGVALLSLWVNQESCHCFDIHSRNQGEDDDDNDGDDDDDGDDEDDDGDGEDADEMIQLLSQRRVASPPLLTLHWAAACISFGL